MRCRDCRHPHRPALLALVDASKLDEFVRAKPYDVAPNAGFHFPRRTQNATARQSCTNTTKSDSRRDCPLGVQRTCLHPIFIPTSTTSNLCWKTTQNGCSPKQPCRPNEGFYSTCAELRSCCVCLSECKLDFHIRLKARM